MIIKSISHTSHRASIKNLIAYVFSDKHLTNEKGESVILTNLLRGKQDTWAKQFQKVEARRRSYYGGKEVRLYHEILSFSPKSKPSKAELEDLIWKYLELRLDSPTLAFAGVHFSGSNYHAHVVIQGIDTYGKSIRKSKSSFQQDVQVALNQYQQKYHPRLSDSIIDYNTPSKEKIKLESHKAWKRKERAGEPTHKEQLNKIIQETFVKSNSIEAFLAELTIQNISTYNRAGTLTGIIYNKRKYRMRKTLGVDFEKLLQPNRRNERLARLKHINLQQKENDKTRER